MDLLWEVGEAVGNSMPTECVSELKMCHKILDGSRMLQKNVGECVLEGSEKLYNIQIFYNNVSMVCMCVPL